MVETGRRRWAPALALVAHVVELGAGAGAGRREPARRRSELVPASDSEVTTAAASDSEG